MPQAKSKKKPSSTPPSLTSQIDTLVKRKRAIQQGKAEMNKTMQSYQDRLDKAEAILVDCITEHMGEPTTQNEELVSEARVAKNVLMKQHTQQVYDMEMLPTAIHKIDLKLKALNAERSLLENGVIAHKLTNLTELQDAAREALAEYAAAVCLIGSRNATFVSIDGVVAKLNQDRSVTVLFNQKYRKLEQSMGFEEL